MPILADADTD